jgi:hypothetical protein
MKHSLQTLIGLLSVTFLLLMLCAGCMGQDTVSVPEEDYATPLDAAVLQETIASTSPGALNEREQEDILFMQEEEKLARDVYQNLYDQWNLPVFANIGAAEQTHIDSVGVLVDRYGLSSLMTETPGVFTDPTLQALYDDLVTEGSASTSAALRVGALIEEVDIEDLDNAITRTDKEDIILVYENLMRGSRNHLRSFIQNLDRSGEIYTPQILSSEDYERIISSSIETGT